MVILVTGPESSGKTTLARALAWALDGVFVAEAARDYLNQRDGQYTAADLPNIWALQQEAEDAARASSASFVICDTGPEVIRIWAEVKYGKATEATVRATEERHYDLTLLCQPDLPWQPDPLREAPDPEARAALFQRYRATLPVDGRVQLIHGRARLALALRIINECLT
ncbi:MAG: ATP-binding protein [Bacteroidota bacterium]